MGENSGAAGRNGLQLHRLFPGLAVAIIVSMTAQFLSDHYGGPTLLMALLLGLALNFLAEDGTKTQTGIDFSAKSVLRLGVALLGARISTQELAELGGEMILMVIAGAGATILFALLVAKFFGRGWRFALLTGGAVAICGASAAVAIAAVLPKSDTGERDLAFTVLSVTVLSTIAMVTYPALSTLLNFTSLESGVFLGGTIHDVAQVVGAGFSVGTETGETATLVKLIRVSLLAPVVLIFSLCLRLTGVFKLHGDGKRAPLLPGFVLGFLFLVTLNSLGLVPDAVAALAESASRWALLIAIASVGMRTSLGRVLDVGGTAFVLIILESAWLAGFVLAGIHLLS